MARRRLTPDDEARMVAEAQHKGLGAPRQINRGVGSSAVLSVRVPALQLHALRKIAARKKLSLSDALKEALTGYLASPGLPISSSADRLIFFTSERPIPETSQPGVREVGEQLEEFLRPRARSLTA